MKYQQVSVDLVNMLMTACSYLALAGAAWILLRLLQACFWLPKHFKRQNNVQKMLQDKVDSYERYLAECEAKDKLAGIDSSLDDIDDDTETRDASGSTDKWREQRETLKMLKTELNRIQNGVDVTDWDYLLEESQAEAANSETAQGEEKENRKDLKQEEAVETTELLTEKDDEEPEAKCADKKKDK